MTGRSDAPYAEADRLGAEDLLGAEVSLDPLTVCAEVSVPMSAGGSGVSS